MEIRLFKQGDALRAAFDGVGDDQAVSVRLVYARPISGRDGEISIMDNKGRKELAWLGSLEELDEESRAIARETLWQSYRIAKVTRVTESYVNHGHRYVKIETDRGNRYFNLREPGNNVVRLSPDHLVVRDSMGNRYEIESMARLDAESRENIERVL